MRYFINCTMMTAALAAVLAAPALASTPKCTPAEDLVNAMTKMAAYPDALTDTLKLEMVLVITKEDGTKLNERVFYRAPDGAQTPLPVDEDNIMTGTQALAGADAKGELCRAPHEGGASLEERSSIEANMMFAYNDAGGLHSANSIIDGAKDGREQLKALAPAAARLLVPKLKYVLVRSDDETGGPLTVTALRGDAPVDDFDVHYTGDLPAFPVAALKKAKVDAIRIEGGAYTLMAMPKPGKDALSDAPKPAPAAEPTP